jgi:hypothetical protein
MAHGVPTGLRRSLCRQIKLGLNQIWKHRLCPPIASKTHHPLLELAPLIRLPAPSCAISPTKAEHHCASVS